MQRLCRIRRVNVEVHWVLKPTSYTRYTFELGADYAQNFMSKDLKIVEKKIEKLKKSAEVNYRTSLKEEVGEEFLELDVGQERCNSLYPKKVQMKFQKIQLNGLPMITNSIEPSCPMSIIWIFRPQDLQACCAVSQGSTCWLWETFYRYNGFHVRRCLDYLFTDAYFRDNILTRNSRSRLVGLELELCLVDVKYTGELFEPGIWQMFLKPDDNSDL